MISSRLFVTAIVALIVFASFDSTTAKGPKGKKPKKHTHHVHRNHGHHSIQKRPSNRYDGHVGSHRGREWHGKNAAELDARRQAHQDRRSPQIRDKQSRRPETLYHADRREHGHTDVANRNPQLADGVHSKNVRYRNEERKLQHRLNQAEHLRQLSERNGNPHLAETADRMEQKALEHYEKRLQRIDPAALTDGALPEDWGPDSPIGDPTNLAPLNDAPPPLSNEFQRRLMSAQQALQRRLDTADRLRELANVSGDSRMLEAANRLEDAAFDRFDRRLDQNSLALPQQPGDVVRNH